MHLPVTGLMARMLADEPDDRDAGMVVVARPSEAIERRQASAETAIPATRHDTLRVAA